MHFMQREWLTFANFCREKILAVEIYHENQFTLTIALSPAQFQETILRLLFLLKKTIKTVALMRNLKTAKKSRYIDFKTLTLFLTHSLISKSMPFGMCFSYSLSDECLRTKLRVTENRSFPFLHFCYQRSLLCT